MAKSITAMDPRFNIVVSAFRDGADAPITECVSGEVQSLITKPSTSELIYNNRCRC
jgi:hypothetical protein